MGRYLKNLAIAFFDLPLNALLGGDPEETISSRVGKLQRDGKRVGLVLAPVIDFIFGKDHCKNNIQECEGSDAVI